MTIVIVTLTVLLPGGSTKNKKQIQKTQQFESPSNDNLSDSVKKDELVKND
jgi:hypothetical protein